MNKEEIVKNKNLFDEEKIIDTGMKELLFIRMPFDEYKKLQEENKNIKENNLSYQKELAKAWKENEELKRKTYKAYITDKGKLKFVFDNYISKDKIRNKIKELEASYKKYEREGLSNFIDKLDIGTRIEVLKELLGDE